MQQNNSQLYSKKEIKNLLLHLNTYDLTSNFQKFFPSKTSSHNSWKTAQLCKIFCSNVPLTVQQLECNALSPEFPGEVSSLNLLEASCLFREYLKYIQLKSCIKSASYFYCFDGFKSMTIVTCQWACHSILFICVATPVLAPTMLDVPSWH